MTAPAEGSSSPAAASTSPVSVPAAAAANGLVPLSNREIRELKGRSQRLTAVTKLGKSGLSPEFLLGVQHELAQHELIKIKLTEHKDQRYELAEQLAAKTQSHLIWVIGHVIVLYRARAIGAEPGRPVSAKPARPAASGKPAVTTSATSGSVRQAPGAKTKSTAPVAPSRPAVTWKPIGVISEVVQAPRSAGRRSPPPSR